MTSRTFGPSRADERTLVEQLRGSVTGLLSEQFDDSGTDYLNEIIPKPWGHEFRVYADDLYDVWKLCLRPGQGTSVHCHPRKLTALLCLAGSGRMQLLHDELEVTAGDVAVIGRGVFHGTENPAEEDLHLVEVEVPRNKFDLVRLQDRYGRANAGYEALDVAAQVALRPGRVIHRSKHRTGTALDGFVFGISAGLDVASNVHDDVLFAVSLSVAAALEQSVTVLGPSELRTGLDPEQLYLTIRGNAAAASTTRSDSTCLVP
jgi:mannose-6-phosphate isomerase-like protein (cupin superfamily)